MYRRKSSTGTLTLERETLHLSDDTGRVALIDTRTIGTGAEPAQLLRYQYSNHLGSAALETDGAGVVISYEEYYPYGSTSGRSGRWAATKRYRYTGKERDEESGFYYHGARYYAPWLSRWIAADPLESKYAGMSPYNYGFNNPVKWTDSTGMEPDGGDNKGGARLETKQPTSGQWEQRNQNGYTGKAAPPFQLSEITVGSTQPHGKGNPLSVGMERAQALSIRIPKAEQEVLMADIYENGHMGPKSVVSAQVRHIEQEHAFRVADNVRGGVGGALGYVVAGELGAEIGAMADNMAQGLFFQRVEPVVGARFSGMPRAKEVPKTELPVIKTKEPTGRTFSLSSQQTAEVNQNYSISTQAFDVVKAYKDALSPFKNGDLTKAGRAVTKHPQYFGFESTEALREVYRTSEALNSLASNQLKEILRNGIKTSGSGGRYPNGWVTYTLPNGNAASWELNGKFIGFRGLKK